MTVDVITTRAQVTPEWLTGVLALSGALEEGGVSGFEFVDSLDRELSSSFRLRVSYQPDSRGELPVALFLKLVDTRYDGDDDPLQTSEVDYYTRDYIGVEGVPLLRCYGAAVSVDGRHYYVLIEDVSDTHVMAYEKPLTLEYGLALADGMAAMHARWWGGERLAEAGQPIHGAEVIEKFVAIARPGVENIVDCCVSELEPHWPQAMLDIYEHHPRLLIDRTRNLSGFTLIHGDPNPTNILVPVEGDHPIYVIDRGPFEWSLTTWLGVYDLAYAMVLPLYTWDIETRRAWERQVLERYHAGLLERGVVDYSWEQLWEDYRLMVPMCVYVATENFRGSAGLENKHIWMPQLQKALTACDDLGCAELWAGKEST